MPNKLHIRVIFTPGTNLETISCKSRPLDNKMCDLGNQNKCVICPNLIGSKCTTKDAIYRVICDVCTKSYLGEPNVEEQRINFLLVQKMRSYGQRYLTEHWTTSYIKL